MATVSTFRPYAYTSDADLDVIADLINTCRAVDDLEHRTSVAKLKEDFADPQFDIAHDLQLWRDDTGELVAMAELWRRTQTEVLGTLHFEIHPQVRGGELAAEVMAWAEQRLREAGQALSLPLILRSGCRDSLQWQRSLLADFGFTPERYFFRLKRSLKESIPTPQIPDGWKIRSVDAQKDAEAWVDMFNQTFVDHWNHHPLSLDEYHYYTTLSSYDPTLDLVIETPEGEMVTFCMSEIDPEYNARLGLKEGYVDLLGTRRGYRRLGLARALLFAGLNRLKAAGMETATLGVDAQNPLGALGLYESMGFQKDRSSTVFRKELEVRS